MAHRRYVAGVLCAFGLSSLFWVSGPDATDEPCPPVCNYESPGFRFTVVDRDTGQPLTDVFALAEWIQYGYHGRGGPIMVQDAVSGPDGLLVFPPWGPTRGSSGGLVINQDPFVTLFQPGYKTVAMSNWIPNPIDERLRVRGFGRNGQRIGMEPFRGNPEEWMAELRKAVQGAAASHSEDQILRFRSSYVNRAKRLLVERQNAPAKYQAPAQFFWHMQRELEFLDRGSR